MTPERAHHRGLDPADCSIHSHARKYGGKWVVLAHGRAVCEFEPTDVYGACWWLARLRRLADAG